MNPRITGLLLAIIVVACFVTGAIVYPHLPVVAISHWNAVGQPDGMMSRAWAAFLLPGIMLVLFGIWALLPQIDPIAPGFKSFRYVYDFFWILITAFLAYVYALTLGANIGWRFDMVKAIAPAVALLIFLLGTFLPRVKRNWFFGIRTPWSLTSDKVWDKTHEFGGRLLQIAGILILIGTFTSRLWTLGLIIVPIVVAGIAAIVYSYLEFRREGGR